MVRTNELQAERKRAGVTLTDCAKAISCSVNTYCAKENNKQPFTIDEAILLCDFLGIDSGERRAFIFLC
jgi:DNA-binding XRE family transcriptional regulator